VTTRSGEPRATLQAVRGFWEAHLNNEYYTHEARGTEAFFADIERRRYEWHYHLRDLFGDLRGGSGTLLEVGCGMGIDSIQLARCGFQVTAIDLTENAIALARQLAAMRGAKIDFIAGNAEALDFGDETFDAVYSFGVLHHTPDIQRAIAEVYRVLRPGGIAYVMLYHKWSFVHAIHQLFRLPYESPRHLKDHCPVVHAYSKRGVRSLFHAFPTMHIASAYPFTYGFRHLIGWVPEFVLRPLGRLAGWHLMIRAQR
jgi:ubiquinone/menaquinone biosynthesis C-methylase UbiE